MTHYDTLEVSPQASPEVVRAAYRSLIQRFHPDRHPGDSAAAARATAITEAYEVLSDPARRSAYDARLAAGAQVAGAQVAGTPAAAAMATAMAARRPPLPRRPPPAAAGWHAWLPWMLAVPAVVAGAVWLAQPRNDPRAELLAIRDAFAQQDVPQARLRELYARKEALLQQAPQLQAEWAAEAARQRASRTLELLDAPLVVHTDKGELRVPRLRIVLGSFDAASLRAHIERHRERLVQDVRDRLAQPDGVALAGAAGADSLKTLVAGALTRSLGTKPEDDYPSTFFESPGRHGVVDVLLPEGFLFTPPPGRVAAEQPAS